MALTSKLASCAAGAPATATDSAGGKRSTSACCSALSTTGNPDSSSLPFACAPTAGVAESEDVEATAGVGAADSRSDVGGWAEGDAAEDADTSSSTVVLGSTGAPSSSASGEGCSLHSVSAAWTMALISWSGAAATSVPAATRPGALASSCVDTKDPGVIPGDAASEIAGAGLAVTRSALWPPGCDASVCGPDSRCRRLMRTGLFIVARGSVCSASGGPKKKRRAGRNRFPSGGSSAPRASTQSRRYSRPLRSRKSSGSSKGCRRQ